RDQVLSRAYAGVRDLPDRAAVRTTAAYSSGVSLLGDQGLIARGVPPGLGTSAVDRCRTAGSGPFSLPAPLRDMWLFRWFGCVVCTVAPPAPLDRFAPVVPLVPWAGDSLLPSASTNRINRPISSCSAWFSSARYCTASARSAICRSSERSGELPGASTLSGLTSFLGFASFGRFGSLTKRTSLAAFASLPRSVSSLNFSS